MAITESKHVIPTDLLADTQAIIDHLISGKLLDPEVTRRVRERAERIREEIRQKHGVLDIGVPAIRELRDGP
jgi:hypothetical protein